MEVPIEAPREIKKAIAKRLQKSGALKRIERKIKLGMMVAVEEIREDPKAPGNLERRKFKDASVHESKALQAIYNFLSERNMSYTLSCLLEESTVRRNTSDVTDILDYIDSDPAERAQQSESDAQNEEEEVNQKDSDDFLNSSYDESM